MPRQARLDAPGTLHHVILRGIEKRRIVGDDKDRQNFIKRLGDLSEETETRIYRKSKGGQFFIVDNLADVNWEIVAP